MAAQVFNFQTFYTQELEYLNADLDYYKSLDRDGNLDECKKPVIFNGLYKLAWDYFALQQNTTHNEAVYNQAVLGGLAPIANTDPRLPAIIDTDAEFLETMNLYCKIIGMVLSGLMDIAYNDNITGFKTWLTENPVFQMSLPVVNLVHTPLVAGVPNGAQDGATLIGVYAREAFALAKGAVPNTDIDLQNIATLNQAVADCAAECRRFRAALAAVNGVTGAAGRTVPQITNPFDGQVPDDLPSSRAKYFDHLLLALTRGTVIEMDNYNGSVKRVADILPRRASDVDRLIKEDVEKIANKTGDAVAAAPQDDANVTTVFTKGLNTDRDLLITAMPRRMTHTCIAGCNPIYETAAGRAGRPGPTVKIMSYNNKQYVCPIQTRDDENVNNVRTEMIPDLNLRIEGKQAVTMATPLVAANQYKIRDVVGGIPGPNPQPLKSRTLGIFGRRELSACTTDTTDAENMTQLPLNYVSYGKEPGHGDWQSMPNYATLWMILLTANTKNVTVESEGAYVFSERQSGIKCFTFQSILVGRDKFVVPKNDSNCMLPSNWELFAMHPTGKLLYHNKSTGDLQVNPPPGSYWKQWRGAKYIHSYMAEIGYQDAKTKYNDDHRIQGLNLTPLQQEELFQKGAHDKLIEYVRSLTTYRRTGGSRNNNKKRYNKKTMMSILKTAKRKYFTRRNKTKQ